jgi:hypothetical protein
MIELILTVIGAIIGSLSITALLWWITESK